MTCELNSPTNHNSENTNRLNNSQVQQLATAMPSLKERSKTLVELLKSAGFIWAQTTY